MASPCAACGGPEPAGRRVSADPALAAAHLLGPLLCRILLQAAAVPDRLLAEVIDGVADWRAPDPMRSRPSSAPGQPAGSNQQTKAAAQP